MNAVALRADDIMPIQGEPRVYDLRLSETLGFSRPQNIRKVVRRNVKELATHGDMPIKQGRTYSVVGGRPEQGYYLNEAQALLVCMFSRTNEAAAARKQIIDVFLAHRQGKLVPVGRKSAAKDRDLPWAKMEQRIKRIERMIDIQEKVESEAFSNAVAYAPTILFLDGAGGKPKKQTRPRWWYDREVREAVIACHRQWKRSERNPEPMGATLHSIGRLYAALEQIAAERSRPARKRAGGRA